VKVGGQRHAPAALPPGIEPVPIVYEAGWDPEPVWMGAKSNIINMQTMATKKDIL
jgi:hypothetical protein